ncbi:hypothetical protein XELAEV_18015815mg [Xenopus laevis]|uniref:Uncharacterized protein n=1 Tax=Xenopus laevis TaxID=8355 RepID=A0A974DJD9_XENLA|nr:hypothetical protein XELAEV_18015815mg [Xenopus laevis]
MYKVQYTNLHCYGSPGLNSRLPKQTRTDSLVWLLCSHSLTPLPHFLFPLSPRYYFYCLLFSSPLGSLRSIDSRLANTYHILQLEHVTTALILTIIRLYAQYIGLLVTQRYVFSSAYKSCYSILR